MGNEWSLHTDYRQTKPHIGWMLFENFYLKLSMFKLSWRLESCLARTASLEAGPLGTPLMLLMKWPTAQGGNALSFPHSGITKVGQELPHLIRGALKRVGHRSFAVSLSSRR